ncbi:hypothetical protein N1851_028330 [Merluccius polli]|uniref:Uncharacterized protein n=1 Tax=Merluccius polli TaxID=89951 RepID=A0AA47M8Y5_MERPO|nr:hypothetical protein N1851_028330 [Merluccius polli]
MRFLRRVAGLSLRVKSSAIQEDLGVEPLLLRIERSQLRHGQLGPRSRWRDYISQLALEWPSEFLRNRWRKLPGKRMSGPPCYACCLLDPDPDNACRAKQLSYWPTPAARPRMLTDRQATTTKYQKKERKKSTGDAEGARFSRAAHRKVAPPADAPVRGNSVSGSACRFTGPISEQEARPENSEVEVVREFQLLSFTGQAIIATFCAHLLRPARGEVASAEGFDSHLQSTVQGGLASCFRVQEEELSHRH